MSYQVIKDYESCYSTEYFNVDVDFYYDVQKGLPFLSHMECNVYFKGRLSNEMVFTSMQVFSSDEDAVKFFDNLEKKCKIMIVLLKHVKEYGGCYNTFVGIIDDDIESVVDSLMSEFKIEEN